MRRSASRRTTPAAVAVAIVGTLLVAGCRHATSQGDLARFAEAAGKVHVQTDLAFARANAISRKNEIDAFVATRRPGISERAFPPALDPQSIAAWDQALSDLERYGGLLAELLDGDRGVRSASDITGLGRELQTGEVGAHIDAGVATGFATLAGVLMDASARSSARTIMRRTDPAIHRVLTSMAGAIGTDRTEGIQGTVWANWTASQTGLRDSYADASEKGDAAKQRAIAVDFLETIDRRDADLQALSSLKASLLALADAHSAAAAGSRLRQQQIIDGLDRRLVEARRDVRTLKGTSDAE